ncbi:hypothetical protein KIF53_15540 [Chromobacterium subtsugae]|uniref:Phage protein n=1 Tax=Chromobacterium subtsugae TaxID=251747 RepID=A0ABS7FGC5_9NEIS|nr:MULTISPECIES: hypothetical protein [Chromobacterium]KUM02746.1 hypothetical protein Cv017_01455 [Chromobacterium subtsugae]KZE84963.1 hypothetical protein AWB61_03005 [Chromobacterium sp. F49]MBW7567819.1 hypothetical protein [Chromobacterium subtsugae]MBW8289046.1 hypothetical protein [Chromobacterium subtsugae]WSE93810.1 hypothetical protein U6115_11360 [Chromobacterium subtsugae]
MNIHLHCPIQSSIAHHIHAETLAAAADHQFDRLREQYTTNGIDWSDVANRNEATMAMAAQVLALVYGMPDCPARRKTIQLLDAATDSYAQDMVREAA